MKDLIRRVLDKHKDEQVNLASEAAREGLAEELSEEITDWIRNLWKEDFDGSL